MPAGYSGRATADHPPGFYGPPDGLLAVNALTPTDRPVALDYSALNARLEAYQVGEPMDLRGPVLLTALALLALDAIVRMSRAERGALYLDAMADAIARWARSELT